jgi:hypothetical protein
VPNSCNCTQALIYTGGVRSKDGINVNGRDYLFISSRGLANFNGDNKKRWLLGFCVILGYVCVGNTLHPLLCPAFRSTSVYRDASSNLKIESFGRFKEIDNGSGTALSSLDRTRRHNVQLLLRYTLVELVVYYKT